MNISIEKFPIMRCYVNSLWIDNESRWSGPKLQFHQCTNSKPRLFFRSNHFEEKNPQIFNENAERDAVIDSSSNCKGDQKDMISLDIISSADAADQIIDVETRESDFWIEYNKKFVITQSEDFSIDFFQRKS